MDAIAGHFLCHDELCPFACACGYTAGTSDAFERHLRRVRETVVLGRHVQLDVIQAMSGAPFKGLGAMTSWTARQVIAELEKSMPLGMRICALLYQDCLVTDAMTLADCGISGEHAILQVILGSMQTEQLVTNGHLAADLLTRGYTVADLKKAGYGANALRRCGISCAVLKEAGYLARDVLSAGYGADDFTSTELNAAGFNASRLRREHFQKAADLATAGFDIVELKAAGFNAIELKDAHFKAADLLTAGFDIMELKAAGFNETELKAAIHLEKAADLVTTGSDIMELKAAGFNASGFNARQLLEAGYSATAIMKAGHSIADSDLRKRLKEAGYSIGCKKRRSNRDAHTVKPQWDASVLRRTHHLRHLLVLGRETRRQLLVAASDSSTAGDRDADRVSKSDRRQAYLLRQANEKSHKLACKNRRLAIAHRKGKNSKNCRLGCGKRGSPLWWGFDVEADEVHGLVAG